MKDSLSKIVSESLSYTYNYINKNISSKLDLMDKRIKNLESKVSKLNVQNNNLNKNINLESQINSIWLKSLELISQNKISEAYNLIISSQDDIYL